MISAALQGAVVMLVSFLVLEVVAVSLIAEYVVSRAVHSYFGWMIVTAFATVPSLMFCWVANAVLSLCSDRVRVISLCFFGGLALLQMAMIILRFSDFWYDKGMAMIMLAGPSLSVLLVINNRNTYTDPQVGQE